MCSLVVLSDLDGTLIDSRASVTAAFRWWATLRGHDAAHVAERIPFGLTSTDAVRELDPNADAEADGALLDKRQEQDASAVRALPGARYLLRQQRWPLAIVTSCPRPLALARLRAAGLPTDCSLITPEQWTRGKPDPEPYRLGAAALDAEPERCVVLEDAPAGVQAGRAAGMRVAAVLSTLSATQLPGADAYINDLREVPGLLDAWG